MRFDADLKVVMKANPGRPIKSVAKNISKGGAMIISNANYKLDAIVDIKMTFSSGNCFSSTAKILRKIPYAEGNFSYGVEFSDISGDNSKIINSEIAQYEREFLKSLNILREYKNKSESVFDTKIAIISYQADESYEIRETLVKIGAEDFQVYHNFKFYTGFFAEEQPKVVIIDAEKINDEILDIIQNITGEFQGMYIVLLVPIEYAGQKYDLGVESEKINILYTPLIYDEFEKEIVKYL